MKKIYKKIIILFSLIILGIFVNSVDVNAASASISASSQNVNVGDKVTITVNATGCLSELSVSGPGVSGNLDIVNTNLENESKSAVYTLDTSSVGTKTVTLKGSIVDADKSEVEINKSVTITVAEKKQEQQPAQPAQPTQPTQPAQPTKPAVTFNAKNDTIYVNVDNANLRDGADGKVIGSVKKNTALTRTGISSDGAWNRVSYNGGTYYIATSVITTTKPAESKEEENKDKEDEKKPTEKSTNKALKDLVVENYKLTPDFDPEITKYTLEVTKEVEKLEITPLLQDDKAKFEITGNDSFKEGNNIVKITVTAEDGTNRIYTITVAKSNKDGEENALDDMLRLSKLEVRNIALDPTFKPETTNYSVLVSDPSSIKIADITAVAEDEDVEVTIAEAEADKNGNRIITIMLENKDGDKSGVYQITVKKGIVNPIVELQRNQNKKIYYVLGAIIGVLVVAIIVVIVLLRKTSNKYDMIDIKEADELSDDFDYSLKNAIDNTNFGEEMQEYDDLIEDSSLKSQILNNSNDYNVFNNEEELFGADDETKSYNLSDYNDDFTNKGKKKGKHF